MNYYRINFFNVRHNYMGYEIVHASSETEARDKFWTQYFHRKDYINIVGISQCYVDPETGTILG